MYVDAILEKKTDTIHVVERVNGHRVLRDIPAPYVFYYHDNGGSYHSIYGHRCKRFTGNNNHKFRAQLQHWRDAGRRIFESDINPVFRALADTYSGAETPSMHLGFFDIEVGFDKQRGFAPPDNPFNPVTAITLYRSADQKLLSFVLRPPTFDQAQAENAIAAFPDTVLFDDETALLSAFLDAIEDVDCLTGWNSSAYDIPYLVNRIKQTINIRTIKRFCLWDQVPSARQYKNKFGKLVDTFDLVGRVHIDYLDLYAKHVQQQRLSYKLDSIADIEIGETKVAYDSTLDDLYLKDFEKFVRYNRQDVMLMVNIDRKLKFIELANQIAHANYVLLKTTMGSVTLVETAIINEMHDMGYVVPDRPPREKEEADDEIPDEEIEEDESIVDGHTPVVGAYVAQPKKGLQDHIGCVDINSLYPSAIRALNMSPETLIGQVQSTETMDLIHQRTSKLPRNKWAEAWDGLFCTVEVQHMHDQDSTIMKVDFFDHIQDTVTTQEMTGKQLHAYVFDPANHVCISANGTIFDTTTEGMIPKLLAKWYAERKTMQANKKEHEDALKLLEEQAREQDHDERAEYHRYQETFWNQRQGAKKLVLNATYGAMLNEYFRMYDPRLGQSTTLTGRSIVRHMNAKINEIITGIDDHQGDAIIYADTDSCYFSAYRVLKDHPNFKTVDWSRENIITMYDAIAKEANGTFAVFMDTTFHTGLERGDIIRAGRELVASKGLFIKKKKYAVLVYDQEGNRLDHDGKPGKLKVMGLDLKRADTPKIMQQFLERLLLDLLTDASQQQMFASIMDFRQSFKMRPGWEKGSPKKVANLSEFVTKLEASNKKGLTLSGKMKRDEKLRVNVPGHVTASLNWNRLCDLNDDHYATRITDSNRIIVCKLRKNTTGMTSVAYPIDEAHLPNWFKELPFDDEAMEETIIDSKILNLVGVLNWDLSDTRMKAGTDLFSWS